MNLHNKRLQPLDVTREWLALHPNVVYWRQDCYEYDGRCYRKLDELDLSLHKWMNDGGYSPSLSFVATVETQIKAQIVLDSSLPLPCWKPGVAGGEAIPFRNGIYMVDSGEFREHTPDYLSLFALPYDYDPEATCPRWLEFHDQVFSGDAERIKLHQQWFGYCLTSDARYQRYLLKIGPKRAGKGTTDEILQAVIGDGCVSVRLSDLVDRFGLSSLVGKRVAVTGETHLEGLGKSRVAILERLKSIVGLDLQAINRRYRETISVRLPIKFTVSANDVPSLYDNSNALSARMLLLRFDRSFAGREDFYLQDKLKRELPGIANWAIEGMKSLRAEGRFVEPASAEEERERIYEESSPAEAFVRDRLVVWKPMTTDDNHRFAVTDAPVEIDKKRLDLVYSDWLQETHSYQLSFPVFCKQLRSLLPKLTEIRRKNSGGRQRVLVGIAERE